MIAVLVEVSVTMPEGAAADSAARLELAEAWIKSKLEGTARSEGDAPLKVANVEAVAEVEGV